MRIVVSSIFVDHQDKALAFYTTKLGFVKKADIPLGAARWLTVVAPDAPDGTELVLEPDNHPAVGPFKRALMQDGIPFASFAVDDIHSDHRRLRPAAGQFNPPPADRGPVTAPRLNSASWNRIHLAPPR